MPILTTLERDILTCIEIVGATDADDISDILGENPREVQEALHSLDDRGYVIMRLGWYRLSEAHKGGRL